MSLAISSAVSATADVNLQVNPPFPGGFRNHSRIFFFYEAEQNITAQEESLGEIIKALFREAKEVAFEDGMETEFSKELIRLVKRHGKSAMEVITALLVNENVDAEVASEALRWLGRMDHPPSYRDRLWLLERSLFSSSALIRDGAALGLASLDNPHAIPYLRQAIEQEKYASLREDLEQVLEQLESTRSAVSPKAHP
jgi:HEAT repeat protein